MEVARRVCTGIAHECMCTGGVRTDKVTDKVMDNRHNKAGVTTTVSIRMSRVTGSGQQHLTAQCKVHMHGHWHTCTHFVIGTQVRTVSAGPLNKETMMGGKSLCEVHG